MSKGSHSDDETKMRVATKTCAYQNRSLIVLETFDALSK